MLITCISYSMARGVDKSACLIVAGCDGCTADAEHWPQQWPHLYVVPPHAPCPWFGMLAMFRATVAEVWWLLIISQDLGGAWDGTFASWAPPHHFLPKIFALYLSGKCLGAPKKSCWGRLRKVSGTQLTIHYKIITLQIRVLVTPHWIYTRCAWAGGTFFPVVLLCQFFGSGGK